jgi:hypothetical protein
MHLFILGSDLGYVKISIPYIYIYFITSFYYFFLI